MNRNDQLALLNAYTSAFNALDEAEIVLRTTLAKLRDRLHDRIVCLEDERIAATSIIATASYELGMPQLATSL